MVSEEPPELNNTSSVNPAMPQTIIASLEMEIVLLGLLIAASLSALGMAVVGAVLIQLPANYFSGSAPKGFLPNAHPVFRWTGLVLKNIVGLGVVLLGVLLTLPGVPGPGLLTILLGIMLMDVPGKRRLERWLISRPKVLAAVNRLRRQFRRGPFVL
jgi:hypothetical protein